MSKCKYCEEIEVTDPDGEELFFDFPVKIEGVRMYYGNRFGQYKLHVEVDGADMMVSDADFCVMCERGF